MLLFKQNAFSRPFAWQPLFQEAFVSYKARLLCRHATLSVTLASPHGLLSPLACKFSEGSDCHPHVFRISTVSVPSRNYDKTWNRMKLNKKRTIPQYDILILVRTVVLV